MKSIVEAVFTYAKETPDKLCVADAGSSYTYLEYSRKISKIARLLMDKAVGAGDKVVVKCTQNVDYLALAFGIQLIRAVFVPLEKSCSDEKLMHIAEICRAKFVFTDKANDLNDGFMLLISDFIRESEILEESAFLPENFPGNNEICEILFSTGTTGKEKGIEITNANNIALAENVIYGVEMKDDNVELIPSPMNHSHGLRRYYANMYKGASVIVQNGVMNAKLFFNLMDKYKVNSIDLVPTALSVLLKLSKDRFGEYKEILRYIQLGSAPLMEEDKNKVKRLLPATRLYNFYGSTESGCICIYDFNSGKDKPNCIGKPTHNAEIFMVDENRKTVLSSKENTGLLASRGGQNSPGYFEDEEETKLAMEDGVVYSKDEAYFDEDGDIILLGRKNDVINVGGNKVSPEEIENEVLKIEGIKDCGCISVKDAVKGEVPKLFVVMEPGRELDIKYIKTVLMGKMEAFKVPQFIEIIDKIPRTFNGKILRRELE
jgi:hypothetical protein